MSIMQTGLTPDTFERLLYDQGLVYVDYGLGGERLIGATRGGNKLEIIPEIRKMPFDGAPGDVKGDKRKTGVSVKLTVNVSEWATNNILMALAGSESTADSTHDIITCDRNIQAGDYFSNVTMLLDKSATTTPFLVQVSNALALTGLTIDGKEKDEAINTIEFTGHYATTDLDTEPWQIKNPLEVGTGFYTLTYLAGANGQILGNSTQIIASGGDGSPVYAAAASGYSFTSWSDASTDNPRTDTSVSADVTVTASFA
jgi:hypothetical protein